MANAAYNPPVAKDDPLKLELSHSLAKIPETAPSSSHANTASVAPPAPASTATHSSYWWSDFALIGALLTGAVLVVAAFLYWRRKNEASLPLTESVLWAQAPIGFQETQQPMASADPVIRVPDEVPAPVALPVARMSDIQNLATQLKALLRMRDDVGANKLLTRHVVTHSRTSPWVFLELFQILTRMNEPKQWAHMRAAFRSQFGQVGPEWGKPLPMGALESDALLTSELTRLWPSTNTRVWIERWMVGGDSPSAPPVLTLEMYRELLWMEKYLIEIIRDVMTKQRAKHKKGLALQDKNKD